MMRSLSAAVKLLAAATAVSAEGLSKVASGPFGHMQRFQDLHHERQLQAHNYAVARDRVEERQAKEPRFLNNQTESTSFRKLDIYILLYVKTISSANAHV